MRIGNWACRGAAAVLISLATILFAPPIAYAQDPAAFYKGRHVDLYIRYSVCGAYDLYARVLARHLSKHIPGNPTIVPKNLEGAGSLRLANWLYNVAPKDGTAMGTIGRGAAVGPLLRSKGGRVPAGR